MREVLLDTLVTPGLAGIQASRRSSDPDAEKIVIVQDVYPSVQVQRAIPQICRDLTAGAGVRLIALEGPLGPVQLPPGTDTQEEVLRLFPQLSGATANILLLRLPEVVTEGVDDPRMHQEAREAQRYLGHHEDVCHRMLDRIVQVLSAAQERLYPPDIVTLRRTVVRLFRSQRNLSEQVALVKHAAAGLGIDLGQFPSFQAFDEALRLEGEIDFEATERERKDLVERFAHALGDALEPDPAGRVPEDRCATVLRFWMRRSGITEEEMRRNIQLRGLSTVLGECQEALLGWVTNAAHGVRFEHESAGEQAPLLTTMFQMLDDLGMTGGELPNLERYIRYLKVAVEGIDQKALLRELPQWSQLLVDALSSPQARELQQIEDDLTLIGLGIRMELAPDQAESAPLDAAALRERLERLTRLGGDSVRPPLSQVPAALAEALSAASVFYTRSLARGEVMGRNTLAAMQRLRTDRALLIAGGFHPRTITKSLEDERRVSWSILLPKFQIDEDPRLKRA